MSKPTTVLDESFPSHLRPANARQSLSSKEMISVAKKFVKAKTKWTIAEVSVVNDCQVHFTLKSGDTRIVYFDWQTSNIFTHNKEEYITVGISKYL